MTRTRKVYWWTAIGLGLWYTWLFRYYVRVDAVAYLDLAEQVSRGDFAALLSSYWSPLYPVMLSLPLALLHPGPALLYPMLHAVNFVGYLFAVAAFFRFLDEVVRASGARARSVPYIEALVFLVFLWTTLEGYVLVSATPDIFVAAVFYWLASLLVRASSRGLDRSSRVELAVALITGYAIKTILLPLGAAALILIAIHESRRRRGLRGLAPAAVLFGGFTSGFVLLLRAKYGRWTWGDSSAFNYLWQVNGVPNWYAIGPGSGSGGLTHDYVVSHELPAFVFSGRSDSSTWPFWTDPGFWLDGLTPRWNLRGQLRLSWRHLLSAAELFGLRLGYFGLALALLFALGRPPAKQVVRAARPYLSALGLSLAGLACYFLLRFDWRYLGAMVTVAFASLAAPVVSRAALAKHAKIVTASIALCACILAGQMVSKAVYTLGLDGRKFGFGARDSFALRNLRMEVADGLHSLGLKKGDRILAVTPENAGWGKIPAPWAKLAGVQIAADLRDQDGKALERLLAMGANERSRVLSAMSGAGVRFVVAPVSELPAAARALPWKTAGSDFGLLSLESLEKRR
jgi:hypothetical protein